MKKKTLFVVLLTVFSLHFSAYQQTAPVSSTPQTEAQGLSFSKPGPYQVGIKRMISFQD